MELALKMVQKGRPQYNEDEQLNLAVWMSKLVRDCPNLSNEMIQRFQ